MRNGGPLKSGLVTTARFGALVWREQRLLALSAIFLTGLVMALWNSNRRTLSRLEGERTALLAETGALSARLGALNTELIRVEGDPRALEGEARERLLMGEPGEYLIPVDEPAAERKL